MPNVTATVYIWYPKGTNVGHAAMHIGAEQSKNRTYRYVSWWPGDAGLAAQERAYKNDMEQEGNDEAHVKYELYDLDITAMATEWDAIRTKDQAHYRTLAKNCSTIVARLLRAGGVEKFLVGSGGDARLVSFAHNVYWTPKNVAELCNVLKKLGKATKTKDVNCPGKASSPTSVLATVVGMR